jgi:hypothetical protein
MELKSDGGKDDGEEDDLALWLSDDLIATSPSVPCASNGGFWDRCLFIG